MLRRLRGPLCVCAVLGALLAFSGCKVGPNFHAPWADTPAQWANSDVAADEPPPARWWSTFGDAQLTSLIDRAVTANLDLAQAQARVLQARASLGIAEAGLWPTLDLTAGYQRQRTPGIGPAGKPRSSFQAGLDASWEIDVFGGIRRGVEAAQSDMQAAVEDRRDILVTLLSEVALNYVNLRSLQEQIAIASSNLESQKHTADVTRQKFQGGLVGALDVANAEAQVATTESQIPQLEAAAQQAIYNIGVLLGLQPQSLVNELSAASHVPPVPPQVPAGLPSDLLRRRPDIRRGEAQLHAATARIGVAVADLFPKFSMTASYGFQSNELRSLLENAKSASWSFGPGGDWTLFQGGGRLANIKLQDARAQEALLAYHQTVLVALSDVESALVGYAKERERNEALVRAVAANRKAVDLALQLYSFGQTDFLNVLSAQRDLYATETALSQSTGNLTADVVAIYKALGGGWEEVEAQSAGQPKDEKSK